MGQVNSNFGQFLLIGRPYSLIGARRAEGIVRSAMAFSQETEGAEKPLALVLQEEFIDEPGQYVHVRNRRIAEWPVEFLTRPKCTKNTIPNFLSPDAPPNRLDILRGNTTKNS